jgi:LacI family transcriptional regulator
LTATPLAKQSAGGDETNFMKSISKQTAARGTPARVTIRDVATRAGVSVATVSRVFNNTAPVNNATRQRVFESASALRYLPNLAARSLITRRTHTVGILIPDLHGEFFSEIMRGVDQVANRHGYHLLVTNSHGDRDAAEVATSNMRGRVDGLILMAPEMDGEFLARVVPDHIPVIMINSSVDMAGRDSLRVDNFQGAYDMVEHLISHGHTRIALLKGSDANNDARERLRGYLSALTNAGLDAPPELQIAGDFTESAGFAGALRFLGLEQPPTAIFASNDSMAIGALSALRERGVRVPDDVAVVGFDDIPIAAYLTPTLASVRVRISDLGARACEQLLHAIKHENQHEPIQEVIPTELIPRQSCGCGGSVEEKVQ